jgi:Bacterial protein of unknown function (Gcw_chp)
MRIWRAAGLVAGWSAVGLPAAAQASVGIEAAFNSNYNWRGLSLTNKPVIQPDVWVSAAGFTGGFWFNVEPSKYTGSNDISEGGGARSGIAEIDPWIEYARTFANVDAKVGWVGYWYNKDNLGIDNSANTSELYAQVSLNNLPVTPTLTGWYDIDKVKGLYLQGELTYGVKVTPAFTLDLGALAGLSAGQEVSASDPSANFLNSGLTHLDFSASTSFGAGAVSIAPAFHFQVSHDPWTKINGLDAGNLDKGSKIWFGVTLSWSQDLGASSPE